MYAFSICFLQNIALAKVIGNWGIVVHEFSSEEFTNA